MGNGKFAKPEWAERITRFRESQGLSQASLAKRLNVSPMAPSRWERGINEPSSEIYMQLGKMAGNPDCWYFWQRGGISRADIDNVVSGFSAGSPDPVGNAVTSSATAQPFFSLPLSVHSDFASGKLEAEVIAVPPSWCPNPARTICVRIRENGMAPIVGEDFIVAIDTSITDPSQLQEALIAVVDRNDVLIVRCLTRYGETEMLIAENRRREPIPYNSYDWRIVGKVLWWIGKA